MLGLTRDQKAYTDYGRRKGTIVWSARLTIDTCVVQV